VTSSNLPALEDNMSRIVVAVAWRTGEVFTIGRNMEGVENVSSGIARSLHYQAEEDPSIRKKVLV
jgi:hypothetical protein